MRGAFCERLMNKGIQATLGPVMGEENIPKKQDPKTLALLKQMLRLDLLHLEKWKKYAQELSLRRKCHEK